MSHNEKLKLTNKKFLQKNSNVTIWKLASEIPFGVLMVKKNFFLKKKKKTLSFT